MSDVQQAKKLLKENPSYTCVLCREETVYTTEKRGIAPMIDYLDAETDLCGFSVADVIVGKAAALLFVLAGVSEVYAEVLSESAQAVLENYGIPYTYGMLTPYIINRQGNGKCPMEVTVADIHEPNAAYEAIRKKLDALRREN